MRKSRPRRFPVDWFLRAGHPVRLIVRGQVVNVGLAGMQIEVNATYDLMSLVEFEVSITPRDMIRLVGQIIHKVDSGRQNTYGVKFCHMESEARKRLSDELLRMLRTQAVAA